MWHRQYFCIYIKYFWLMIITIILSISAVGKCAVWLAAYPRAVWISKMVRSMHDIQSSVHLFVYLIKMVTTDEHVFINIQSNYLKYLLSLIATRHVIFMCAFWTSLKSEITILCFLTPPCLKCLHGGSWWHRCFLPCYHFYVSSLV